jgi:hybrid cluster-associated redox disulfide protein
MGNKITADMYVEDIVDKYPEAVKTLTRLGVICIQCGAPIWGTLREAVEVAGLDVGKVLNEVNRSDLDNRV